MAGSSEPDDGVQAILDDLDKQVQGFRRKASALQEERQGLLKTLSTMSQSHNLPGLTPCEQEEVSAHVNRLMYRCLTVDISVETPRSEEQEVVFKQASDYLAKLKETFAKDAEEGNVWLSQLLNACSSEEVKEGPVDSKFQSCLLGCTLEDQKFLKKTLQDWKDNLHKSDKQ